MRSLSAIFVGAVFAFLGVAVGAFAAHGLHLDDYASRVFETGVRYQFYHALALILVGTVGLQKPDCISQWTSVFFTAGIIIFSGSLYILAISGQKMWGAVTPLGGICFLVGWSMWMIKLWNHRK